MRGHAKRLVPVAVAIWLIACGSASAPSESSGATAGSTEPLQISQQSVAAAVLHRADVPELSYKNVPGAPSIAPDPVSAQADWSRFLPGKCDPAHKLSQLPTGLAMATSFPFSGPSGGHAASHAILFASNADATRALDTIASILPCFGTAFPTFRGTPTTVAGLGDQADMLRNQAKFPSLPSESIFYVRKGRLFLDFAFSDGSGLTSGGELRAVRAVVARA